MKKMLILLILPLLAACGVFEKKISHLPVVGTVVTITATKLPQNNLPKTITIDDKKYSLYTIEKASRTTNDGRINYYVNSTRDSYFTVFDQIAENEKDALKLFEIEVNLRQNNGRITTPINRQSGEQFLLSEGYDDNNRLGFLLIGTYDKDLHLLRTRAYLYRPSILTKQSSKEDIDHIIESIIADTKIRY